ncbi:rmlC-like jelly roll fold protein [Tasmannia lanceolata]|uniref:rmlC-like jelly roll fold protein n=1 Tax=Tasmannia lanceolata TaxID=3420 RepID=UPI004064B082
MGSPKMASEIATLLNLVPHPEGGFFSETFRDSSITLSKSLLPPQYKVDRPISTSIYFLLPSGSISHLHRIPCAEVWHFYMGEPLTVFELSEDGQIKLTVLGLDLEAGQRPQYTVPPNVWFGSFPTRDVESHSSNGSSLVRAPLRDAETHYSLVGCTCAPAFQFQDFELAKYEDIIGLAPNANPFIRYLTHTE